MLENLVYKELHDEFEELFKEYSDYNAHTNLSSIKDKDEVFQKHFIDSLRHFMRRDKFKMNIYEGENNIIRSTTTTRWMFRSDCCMIIC